MITLTVQLLNLIASTLTSVLYASSQIGQIIVYMILRVIFFLADIIEAIIKFFTILYEDNRSTFSEEIPAFIIEVFSSILDQCNCCIETFINQIIDTLSLLYSCLRVLYNSFCVCAHMLKFTLVNVGQGLWNLLSFVPFKLPVYTKRGLVLIGSKAVELVQYVYGIILTVIAFLIDVPLESLAGFFTLFLLTMLYSVYQESINYYTLSLYQITIRKISHLYYSTYYYLTNSETRLIVSLGQNENLQPRSLSREDLNLELNENNALEGLCVVCQERQKCVLTLPCRHVSLCRECCVQLYGYQRTCPICRTFIYHSVTVYL